MSTAHATGSIALPDNAPASENASSSMHAQATTTSQGHGPNEGNEAQNAVAPIVASLSNATTDLGRLVHLEKSSPSPNPPCQASEKFFPSTTAWDCPDLQGIPSSRHHAKLQKITQDSNSEVARGEREAKEKDKTVCEECEKSLQKEEHDDEYIPGPSRRRPHASRGGRAPKSEMKLIDQSPTVWHEPDIQGTVYEEATTIMKNKLIAWALGHSNVEMKRKGSCKMCEGSLAARAKGRGLTLKPKGKAKEKRSLVIKLKVKWPVTKTASEEVEDSTEETLEESLQPGKKRMLDPDNDEPQHMYKRLKRQDGL